MTPVLSGGKLKCKSWKKYELFSWEATKLVGLASVCKRAGLKTSSRVRKTIIYPAQPSHAVVPWLTLLQLALQIFNTFVQLSVRKMGDLEKWASGLHTVVVSGLNWTVAKSIPFTQYFHLQLIPRACLLVLIWMHSLASLWENGFQSSLLSFQHHLHFWFASDFSKTSRRAVTI